MKFIANATWFKADCGGGTNNVVFSKNCYPEIVHENNNIATFSWNCLLRELVDVFQITYQWRDHRGCRKTQQEFGIR